MKKEILIPERKSCIAFSVKKSNFFAIAELMDNKQDLKRLLKEKRDLYPGCSHVVYAFFVGDDRIDSGLSDDGEPHGTAGRPVYEVLKGSGITDILLTVTRYYGGKKLGTGGLVSAYSQSAKEVLNNLQIIPKIYTEKIKLKINYKLFDIIKRELVSAGATNFIEDFLSDIELSADIPIEKKKEIETLIRNITKGEVIPEYFE